MAKYKPIAEWWMSRADKYERSMKIWRFIAIILLLGWILFFISFSLTIAYDFGTIVA